MFFCGLVFSGPSFAMTCSDLDKTPEAIFAKTLENEHIASLVQKLKDRGVKFKLIRFPEKLESMSSDQYKIEPFSSTSFYNDIGLTLKEVHLPQSMAFVPGGYLPVETYLKRMIKILELQDQGAIFSGTSGSYNYPWTIEGFRKDAKIKDPALAWIKKFYDSHGSYRFTFEDRDHYWSYYSRIDRQIDIDGMDNRRILIRGYHFTHPDLWPNFPDFVTANLNFN
jgi:hypothetical protein